MINIAGKLERLNQLYSNGYLCECTTWKVVESEYEEDENEELIHTPRCGASSEYKRLLGLI